MSSIYSWQARQFFGSRVEALRGKLSPEQAAKLDAMTWKKQVALITKLVEAGKMG